MKRTREITNEDVLVALMAAVMQKDSRIGPKIAKSYRESDFSIPQTKEDDLRDLAIENRYKSVFVSQIRLFLAHRMGVRRRSKAIRLIIEQLDDQIEAALTLVHEKINAEVHQFVRKQ